uniref:DDE Tnp4 domain-containing protein n=1 Tax=Cyprinus carpio TaxID=7962 RepID=A0A8C1W3I8_CYPCA
HFRLSRSNTFKFKDLILGHILGESKVTSCYSFKLLCDTLQPWLTQQKACVAICIWRLATNLEYRSISHLFGVGLSTCCTIIQEVASVHQASLQLTRPLFLRFSPKSASYELLLALRCFVNMGPELHLTTPLVSKGKQDHSIILQGVVDHRKRCWDINVGRPGRIHNARVFSLSSSYVRGSAGTLLPHWTEIFEGVDLPLFLLGDSAYPLLTWLMKPYPEGGPRAFGCLKGCWCCLLKESDTHITFVSHIVSACCVLNNFCEVQKEEFLEGERVAEEDGPVYDDSGVTQLRYSPKWHQSNAKETDC